MITQTDLDALTNDAQIAYYHHPGTRVTTCTVRTRFDFALVGHSACMNQRDFDVTRGQQLALENALEKLWELEGYYWKRIQEDR